MFSLTAQVFGETNAENVEDRHVVNEDSYASRRRELFPSSTRHGKRELGPPRM